MDTAIDAATGTAAANFGVLRSNTYPGRALVCGLDDRGRNLVQVYLLTGRSENSRNRVLLQGQDGLVFTQAADPVKMKDPKLVIYNAMRECHFLTSASCFIVSNGDQTDTVAEFGMGPLQAALEHRTYEPDESNTSRITAVSGWRSRHGTYVRMSILRRSPFGKKPDTCDYLFENLHPGLGWYISTYSGDGNPLPAFTGEPRLMPLVGAAEEIADMYWNALNEGNRIAIAVKFINLRSRKSRLKIINMYDRI